jgi:HK97 family phage major capsid protein
LARWAFTTSSAEYRDAFAKMVRDPKQGHLGFEPAEVEAWNEVRALQRAMSVGVSTSGGFMVPSYLDPAVYLTNDGQASPIPNLAREITIATKTWTGITSDGVTASYDAELTAVSDDSPTIGQAEIPTHKAQGFVAASIELFEDSTIAEEVVRLFADARDRLDAQKFATGSGTNEPTGIWTALQADTTVQLVSTTAATIGLVDLQTTYRSLPVRWRPNAVWMMNPLYAHSIQNLGTSLSNQYTTDATGIPDRLLTKRLVTDDFAPTTQTTTTRDPEIVFGDFSSYYIVRHVGMAVEFIPHMFDISTGRPVGARGWYAYWRTGAEPVSNKGFRILVDKTTA